ncbi:hypothetical protein AB3N62_10745 [Leptospira sp. WS4.C2]
MNKKKYIFIASLLTLTNCLSRNALRIQEELNPQIKNDSSIITIKLNNFNPSNVSMEFYIQDIDSFEKNGNVFSPTFYFSENFNSHIINFSVPKGKYTGFLFIKSKDTIPYYRSIIGMHTINFGINNDYNKTPDLYSPCVQKTEHASALYSRYIKNTRCNTLNITNDKILFEFSLDDKNEINYGNTFLLLWFSVSFAFFNGPQQYPYALFLVSQGIAGVIIKDVLINFDNHLTFNQ